MRPPVDLDGLSSTQLRDLVSRLLARLTELERTVAEQGEEIARLKGEIARLKGLKGRPDIKPSGMEQATDPGKPGTQRKRPGRGKVRPRVSVEGSGAESGGPGGIALQGLRDLAGAGACAVGACDPLPA